MRVQLPLVFVLLTLVSIPTFAQDSANPLPSDPVTTGPYPRGSKLPTAATPNPKFPLRVQLQLDYNRWNRTYGGYYGIGKFTLSDQSAKEYNFDYGCNVSFLQPQTNQFQARWVKDGHKLEVLLNDPHKNKVHTCTLTALANEPPPPPSRYR